MSRKYVYCTLTVVVIVGFYAGIKLGIMWERDKHLGAGIPPQSMIGGTTTGDGIWYKNGHRFFALPDLTAEQESNPLKTGDPLLRRFREFFPTCYSCSAWSIALGAGKHQGVEDYVIHFIPLNWSLSERSMLVIWKYEKGTSWNPIVVTKDSDIEKAFSSENREQFERYISAIYNENIRELGTIRNLNHSNIDSPTPPTTEEATEKEIKTETETKPEPTKETK